MKEDKKQRVRHTYCELKEATLRAVILSLYAASVDYWISDLFDPKHPLETGNEQVMIEAFGHPTT